MSNAPGHRTLHRRANAWCAISAAASWSLMAGCVGPKYVRPNVTTVSGYKGAPAPAAHGTLADTWQPAQPGDALLKGRWWELFNESELNALEEQLDINNQTIAQYFQNFMAARAQVAAARAGYFPTLTTDPAVTRARQPGTLGAGAVAAGGTTGATGSGGTGAIGSGTFTEYSLPFDVSWEPDLWGRVRNSVHQYQYAAQVSAADLENERLTEQAALAEYYFELRGQDSLQDVYDRTIKADQESLELTKVLFETGIDSQQDVAQAQVTLANAEATAVGVGVNRALYEHAIATLIGKPASSFSMPVKTLTTPVPSFPVGVPSQLLQRRPDVAAAERTMAQANALIGVETTAYFPTLNLTGGAGFESEVLSTLFTAPARFWSIGASLSETLFDGGLRRATLAQYQAAFNADVASYRQTVLVAIQQVEDYLAALRITSQQIVRQRAAVTAAQNYLDIANVRYRTGIDPYLDVMAAELTLLSDQQTEVTLRVNEMTAAVQLIQALGGGWSTQQLPSPAAVTQATALQP